MYSDTVKKRAVETSRNCGKRKIAIDPAVLAGKPVVRGTRLSVEFIIGLLTDGWSENEITRNYPGLTREQIHACMAYAGNRGRT